MAHGDVGMGSLLLVSALLVCPIANDDRDVIQAALLCFFNPESWQLSEWRPKKYVVLRTQFLGKERPAFETQAREMVADTDRELAYWSKRVRQKLTEAQHAEATRQLADSKSLRSGIQSVLSFLPTSQSYTAPSLAPLKSFVWDPRVLITDKRSSFSADVDHPPALERSTAYSRTDRPCYTPDGRYAIVRLHTSWSGFRHGCDLNFLLERNPTGWIKVRVTRKIYV